ncbi:MAG: hypothetical protein IH947_00295 [Bacteroidetes bacterium]|nr:hypothetical protein [Bacteroidota bacterium]MCH8231400.1 hypothetical protein [Bacteroidota bacterium]
MSRNKQKFTEIYQEDFIFEYGFGNAAWSLAGCILDINPENGTLAQLV